jgi:hypothetical protein
MFKPESSAPVWPGAFTNQGVKMADHKNLTHLRACESAFLGLFLVLALSTSVFAQPVPPERSQPQAVGTYKVPSVYLPALKRPEVALNIKAMARLGSGTLPRRDGEPFHVTLKERKSVQNFDQARAQISTLFGLVGLKADLKSVRPAERAIENNGVRADKRLEEYRKPFEAAFEKSFREKVGKPNERTQAELKEAEAEMQRQAQGKSRVYVFNQQYQSIPVEYASLLYVDRDSAPSSISGVIFNQVNLTNKLTLKETEAANAAAAYVTKYAKLRKGPESLSPVMVILPYADGFKYAWKMQVEAEDGPYRVWVDAETGKVLQLLPEFFFDSARGLAFTPDPSTGTVEMTFEVDPPVGGNYRLTLTGELTVHNNGADGVTSSDLTLPSNGSGTANFNVAPLNGTVVDRTSSAGYNSRAQEINAYAWIYHVRSLARDWGSQTLPAFTANVNLGGQQNAFSDGRFYICNATTSNSTSCNALFNAAIDATVLAHEYGHNINGVQYGSGGGFMTGAINEGLADFWSDTIHNTDTFGGWWAHNCPAPVQTGFVPRQSEANDVFPEHRYLGFGNKEAHADGQIISWAMWNVRREFLEQHPTGAITTNTNLMTAMTTAGHEANLFDNSDKSVHDSYVDLEKQLAADSGQSWLTIKILSGFARAGLFLSDREAVIDIDDDYLNRNSATPPTFTVWTGRDYTFDVNNNAVTTGVLPYNTRYKIEVANDADFTVNHLDSGWLTNVVASTGGTATWQLAGAMWDTLKSGSRLYYRVQTTDAGGNNVRNSHTTGDGTVANMNVPYAVINNSGEPGFCDLYPRSCNICKFRPRSCYPIYDPWWWLKCPACNLQIVINPGDEVTRVTVYDNLGRQVGVASRLARPVVINGTRYTHAISLKGKEGVSYVLKAEGANGKELGGKFAPAYAIRDAKGKVAARQFQAVTGK